MRIAEPGDYLLNIFTREILQAKFVYDNGTAIVKEVFHLFDDSPEITTWERFEYLVIEATEELLYLLGEKPQKRE